jgi:HPt (histidine-containing phosphotransfer) domain-containing protein
MASAKPAKPAVVTFGDHEVITPDTSKLRKSLRTAKGEELDPVVSAEGALAQIASHFSNWMIDECERLDAARHKVKQEGLSLETRQELFLAAHDIKGDSGNFGFPEVIPAADSLCRLLEHAPDLAKIPLAIVDQHVDAVRVIVREYARPDIADMAATLTNKLRAVTDEFLVNENQHRPEVLKVIQSPSLVPPEAF